MSILDRILRIGRKSLRKDPPVAAPLAEKPESTYLTQYVVFGRRREGEDSSVCFVDE